ncbi:hypothetical protein B0H19DRAFT_1179462 [Mycena capillaripes]|nr:hypothetical protein B0H19DRAFT_1179462 [Mycena capillaripes]
MSDIELFSPHTLTVKQYKNKKRRRDGEEPPVGEPKAEKKKRKKHHEESGDVPPFVETNADAQEPSLATEKKKKKKEKRDRVHESVDAAEEDPTTEPLEKKKEKRKRDSEGVDFSERSPEHQVGATRERKKKKKRQDNLREDALPENEVAETSTVSVQGVADAPVKKKKKSKEKQVTNSEFSSTSTSDGMFPPPDLTSPPYFPGAQPSMSLFPTFNNPAFPDLALGSNEDVLRALQNLDMSNIAGVLKTLTDAADAANIPLPLGIALNSAHPAPATSSSVSTSNKKHRRPLDLTLPSSSPSHSGHAHMLANKWMGPAKLAELVASEGLVYKKGKFSAIEIQQVNDAMENYRTTRGLSEEDVNKIIFPSDETKKDTAFWSEITSAVSQRPIISVYHYVRRAHHPMKQQGKWRPDEDAKLIQAVTSLGQQWEKVAQSVGRMAPDCRDRYRNYIVDREKRNTGTWTAAEEEKLTQIVTQMTIGKDLDNDIFWTKVSGLMGGTRSRQQCRIKWTDSLSKKYKTEGQAKARWSQRDGFILIHKIDSLNVRDDTEIDWKSLPDSQWNLWSAHTLQRRWQTMKKGIKGFEDMTHPEIMDILRVKNADIPKVIKSAKFVVDSDDDEPRAGSSTGPGTLAGKGRGNEDDSE